MHVEAEVDKLPPGGVRHLDHGGHYFAIVKTNEDGIHTGRPRFFLACITCATLLHESTTGLISRIDGHLEWTPRAPVIKAPPVAVKPTAMRLPCPSCHQLHIDTGDFATEPHRTHSCQNCGEVWRPALVPTVGVRFLPGYKNEK